MKRDKLRKKRLHVWKGELIAICRNISNNSVEKYTTLLGLAILHYSFQAVLKTDFLPKGFTPCYNTLKHPWIYFGAPSYNTTDTANLANLPKTKDMIRQIIFLISQINHQPCYQINSNIPIAIIEFVLFYFMFKTMKS